MTPETARRRSAIDVVEPDMSVETQHVQQKVNTAINADRKAISKSSARQSRKAKENKERPMAVLTPSITGIQGEALRT